MNNFDKAVAITEEIRKTYTFTDKAGEGIEFIIAKKLCELEDKPCKKEQE